MTLYPLNAPDPERDQLFFPRRRDQAKSMGRGASLSTSQRPASAILFSMSSCEFMVLRYGEKYGAVNSSLAWVDVLHWASEQCMASGTPFPYNENYDPGY